VRSEPGVKVVALVRRRRDLTREEFVERWTRAHVALSSRLGMSPYRINVALEPQDDDCTPPYDGTAEMYWPDLAAFRAAIASPEGVLAGDDTANFAASVELIVMEEFVAVP
jgi:uncharacterized protein (TIGR02118 family)